jgi:Flp pilus assembly protein TadG
MLARISMEEKDMNEAFQGDKRHSKQKGKPLVYWRYETSRGKPSAIIHEFNNEHVQFSFQLINYRITHKYTKGECTLKTILVP